MATTRTTGITVLADGRATTINRSLEVLRTILNRAALSYRDPTVAPTSKPCRRLEIMFRLTYPLQGDRIIPNGED